MKQLYKSVFKPALLTMLALSLSYCTPKKTDTASTPLDTQAKTETQMPESLYELYVLGLEPQSHLKDIVTSYLLRAKNEHGEIQNGYFFSVFYDSAANKRFVGEVTETKSNVDLSSGKKTIVIRMDAFVGENKPYCNKTQEDDARSLLDIFVDSVAANTDQTVSARFTRFKFYNNDDLKSVNAEFRGDSTLLYASGTYSWDSTGTLEFQMNRNLRLKQTIEDYHQHMYKEHRELYKKLNK
jgi:hypothetical protein